MPTKGQCHKLVPFEKALEQDLVPIVVVNKIDKPSARPAEVVDEMLELSSGLVQMMTSLTSQWSMLQRSTELLHCQMIQLTKKHYGANL